MLGDLALSVAFFLSGAAGLVFQVVWFHRAGLVLGNSVWAVTIVLSSFMGGLALGNALAPGLLKRFAGPLRAYVGLEFIVAASGLGASLLLPHLGGLVVPLVRLVAETGWAVNLIRLAAAFALLAVPATAMGATLPVLVAAFRPDGWSFGATLGRLYGWNTSGALLGVLAADVLFIRYVGIGGAAWIAAAFSLSAAALAGLSSRARAEARGTDVMVSPANARSEGSVSRSEEPQPPPVMSNRAPTVPDSAFVALPRRKEALPVLVCAGVAGGVLLALEVVWFRFLSLFVLSTTLAVSLMLAAVLGGVAAGGFLAGIWLRRRPGAPALVPAVALAAGAALFGSFALFDWWTSGTQVGDWWRVLWFAVALTGPTALLSGLLFTLLGQILYLETASAVTATARLTLANTVGAMFGPPVAAFVLLPWIGLERTVFLLAMIYGGVGLFALATTGPRPWQTRAVVGAAAAVFALSLFVFPHGAVRDRYFARAANAYAGDGSQIVATREGASETIFLMQQEWHGRPVYHRLVTNGFSMTGTAVPGLRYMRYFAYWPMLTHQGPIERALVVCYGVGVTAGAVLQIPSLASLDVVEISADVVAMSDRIYPPDQHPLHDPRVRLHLEDGRYFLETTDARYDLITGEPPPPRTPGSVNIYTREYFQSVYDHLADGGMATYWLPVGRPNPGTDVDTIIRGFCEVFDDCSLWNATPFDFMLVGSRGASGPRTLQEFSRAWQTPGLQAAMRDVGFERPEQIGATFLGDAPYLRQLTAETPPLTDDFPQRLRPSPSRPSLSDPRYATDSAAADHFRRVLDPTRAREAFARSPLIRSLWPPELIDRTLPYFAEQRILNDALWDGGRPLAHIEDLHALLTGTSLRTLPLWVLGTDDVKLGLVEGIDDGTGAMEYGRGLRGLSGRDYASAAAFFRRAEAKGLVGPTLRPLLTYGLYAAGAVEEASTLVHAAAPGTDEEAHFWAWMAERIGESRK